MQEIVKMSRPKKSKSNKRRIVWANFLSWFSEEFKKLTKKNRNKSKRRLSFTKYISYYLSYVTFFIKRIIWVWLSRLLSSKKLWFVNLVFLGLLILIFIIIGKYLPTVIYRVDSRNYFLTLGSMLGGVLAIVFSFKTLVIQNAVDKYPKGFYEIAVKNIFHEIIFFIISAFILALFVFSLLYGSLHWGLSVLSLQISVFIAGISLLLIYLLYISVQNMMNPNYAFQKATKQTIRKIRDSLKRSQEIADIVLKNPKQKAVNKKQLLALVQQRLAPELMYIQERLNYLFDYHDLLRISGESNSALSVLDQITLIIQEYLESKKETSLLIPSGFLLSFTSDSGSFLTTPIEKLVAIGEFYIKENDNPGITKVIRCITELCKKSLEMKYISKHQTENPILHQCIFYLGQLVGNAIQNNNEEALFQCAVSYKEFAPQILDHNWQIELTSIYTILDKVALKSIELSKTIPFSEVISTYLLLLEKLTLMGHFNYEIELSDLIDHLQRVILYGFIATSSGKVDDVLFTSTTLSSPSEVFVNLARIVTGKVRDEKDDGKRQMWRGIFITLAEGYRRMLRHISDKYKNPNNKLIISFGQSIGGMGVLMLDLTTQDEWKTDKDELIKQVGWYIHQTTWFTSNVQKIRNDSSFSSLIDAVAKVGMKAVDIGESEIAKESIEIIFKYANEMLTKEAGDKHGFTEPRIAEKACYVGVLSLKKKNMQLVKLIKTKISEFQKEYEKLYFPKSMPKEYEKSFERNQLLKELMRLLDNSYIGGRGMGRIFRLVEDSLYDLVTSNDIKHFIYEVWKIKVD